MKKFKWREILNVFFLPDSVTTEPSKWPGVASLRALLDREKDEEAPNLVKKSFQV